jgi:hypothetical protein
LAGCTPGAVHLWRFQWLRQLGDVDGDPLWLIAHDLDQRPGLAVMVDFP